MDNLLAVVRNGHGTGDLYPQVEGLGPSVQEIIAFSRRLKYGLGGKFT